jgi:carbohydrate-selective porin OprB
LWLRLVRAEGLTDELFVYQNVNDSAEDTGGNLEVSEAWYQHFFVPEGLYLVAGKLDMSNYFDNNVAANDEEFQFLNSALVNSAAIAFPENGPGAMFGWIPEKWVQFSAGWAKSDAQWDDLDRNAFGIAEVDFRPMLLGLPGNYRFLVWTGKSEEEFEFDDAGGRGWGAGVSFDQMFNRSVVGFFRFAYADQDVFPVEASWSAGAQIFGYAWGRGEDFLGLAGAQTLISDEVELNDPETLLEAYYSIAVNQHLFLSPDLQVIANPGGNDESDTVAVLGAWAQLDF